MSERNKNTKEEIGENKGTTASPEVQEKDFFEVLKGIKNSQFVRPDGQRIDLRLGVPKNSLKLYKSGSFKYIGLKKGAEVLFQELSNPEIEKLIAQAPRQEDVAILKKALKK